MCRKITSIIAFICLLALSNYALAAQFNWTGGGNDHNWFTTANWNDGAATSVPTKGDRACIEAKAPMPWLATDACCQSLEINPWIWEYGPEDCNFTINSGTFDANCIALSGSSPQFNPAPGWQDTPGVLIVNGGLVRVYDGVPAYANEDAPPGPAYGGRGLWIGGGSTTWWSALGSVIVNDGTVMTPKIAIYNGDITLNGGLLYDTNSSPVEFIIREEWERNKIYVNGGTLGLAGDRVTELNNYITAQRIIPYNTRGEFVGPTYNAVDTTLTADANLGSSWQPSPANYDVDVRFHLDGGLTLSWKAGDWIGAGRANAHYVYMGTAESDVDNVGIGTTGTASALFMDVVDQPVDDVNGDPNLFIAEATVPFKPNYTYYWRVDEVNDTSAISYKGIVWQFKMKTDAASDPEPVVGGGLKIPLQLSWMAGDWSTGIHRVYFASEYGLCNAAGTNTTDGRYRGTVDSPVYPLSKLLDTGAGMAAFGPLDPERNYSWRIDEVSSTGGIKKGTVWNFDTGTFATVEDFQEYAFTEDLNEVWVEAPIVCDGDTRAGSGRVRLIREGQSDRYMQFSYDKTGGTGSRFFSEVGLPYSSSGVNWTSGGVMSSPPKVLELAYRGFATNSSDGHSGYIYDRMYVAVEDKDNNVNITLADPNVQLTGPWTTWAIAYDQLDGSTPTTRVMDMNFVTDLYLGVGVRCLDDFAYGGDGNIMFDNIRVLSATCVPAEGPVADFDGNCVVNVFDLDILATDWLVQEWDYDWTGSMVKPAEPNLWYEFEEAAGSSVADSGARMPGDANGPYNGEVINLNASLTWDTGGHNGGCIYLPAGQLSYVEATTSGNPVWWVTSTPGISFSIWENADMTAYDQFSGWSGIFGIWNPAVNNETLEIHCPSPWPPGYQWGPACNFIKKTPGDGATASSGIRPAGDFGGRWNNWIFIKAPADVNGEHLLLYLNGVLVDDTNSVDDVDVIGALFPAAVGSFRIGTRGGNWGMWSGRIDDFKVFNYALTENEVHYIATDGTGLIHIPLVSPANIKTGSSPEIVNFGDLAMMVDEWMTEKLWP